MRSSAWQLQWHRRRGLVLSSTLPGAGAWRAVPARVLIRGTSLFSVWGVVDSGEGAPLWAEPDLDLLFFGGETESPGICCRLEEVREGRRLAGWRVTGEHARATVVLDMRLAGDCLETRLSVHCPAGARPFPLAAAELQLAEVQVPGDAEFWSAHAYGGRTHGYGRLADLHAPGVPFVHGCIGMGLPLVYVHEPGAHSGTEFEFMLEGRPIAWLCPGATPEHVTWSVRWSTERLLAPGEAHAYGGCLRVRRYAGTPVEQMRAWRDAAAARHGLVSPATPEWCRRANIIEFNMNPANAAENGFTRLDDPRCHELLRTWKEMGFTAIFAVSHNRVGQNWLSPFDYEPCAAVGGHAGEAQMLAWAHALGMRIFLWITTVGVDRDAPEVKAHPDWFTHRPDGSLFYAWDSNPANGYVGYAPDGDPQSSGWRDWLKQQARRVVTRGFDGVFIDGCIPRASNHARWAWPGEGRNGVEDQVRELAAFVRTLRPGLITFVEDEGLQLQAACEMTMGRYTAMTPYLKEAYWDHGMGGGPAVDRPAPARIPPGMARDYLLVRYASILPGVVSNDMVEGYYSEEARPWAVQSLLAGMVPKTHYNFIHAPTAFAPIGDAPAVPEPERAPAHRQRGYEEFIALLRFCRDEPLVREAPLSLEAVRVAGAAGVVGILRPSGQRCLLALVNFGGDGASTKVRLGSPADVPESERARAGQPQRSVWAATELCRSMVDAAPHPGGLISGRRGLDVALAPCGFRIFELRPAAAS